MSSGPPRRTRVRERPPEGRPVRPPAPARVPRALASASARTASRDLPRAGVGIGPARAAGLLGMLVALVLGFALVSGPLFLLDRIDTGTLRWTDRADVVTRLGVKAGDELFGIDAAAAAARLASLPAVLRAEVAVALPDTITVRLTEREPILAWVVGSTTFLVDREGRLFALAPGSPPPAGGPGPAASPDPAASPGPGEGSPARTAAPTPEPATPAPATPAASPDGAASPEPSASPAPSASPDPSLAALPVVVDLRASAAGLRVGSTLSALDLDVATRLASVTATDIGSRADVLSFRVDDTDGYTMVAGPDLWTAVFGTYVPGLRTPDLIPGQVRLLRSLLFGREATVARVYLADDRNGTYVPKAAK